MNEPYIFRERIQNRGVQIDFLRLRCGTEEAFAKAIHGIRPDGKGERPRAFVALSEWDAVVIVPSTKLYSKTLSTMYARPELSETISGMSGYFAYLWNHAINDDLEGTLNAISAGGIGIIASFRFEDTIRRELGLGAEILFCDALAAKIAASGHGLKAAVAHTLGWKDVVVILHASHDSRRLATILSELRLMTVADLTRHANVETLRGIAGTPVFVASYTHLIGGYDTFSRGGLSIGDLARVVDTATLRVRVIPRLENAVRTFISHETGIPAKKMPSEMGHYSFSVDISRFARRRGAVAALALIAKTRKHIGEITERWRNSYAETSTIVRFREPVLNGPGIAPMEAPPKDLAESLRTVRWLLEEMPARLRRQNVTPMTIHRFASILTTLQDYLSDPVRSSVVLHLTNFIADTARLIPRLHRDEIDELCHVSEYALTQAVDGIAQFQHDAASLGLTGRGGYSRLILAVETYVRDMFEALDVDETHLPLITFGQRKGNVGVTGRFQIDISFNVLFMPSRWYILLHEVGHKVWVEHYGWMAESLAVYEKLERIHPLKFRKPETSKLRTRVEYFRTRSIVQELFPNFLVFVLACGNDLPTFDRTSLRIILKVGGRAETSRGLVIAAALHSLMRMLSEHKARGARWWSAWQRVTSAQMTKACASACSAIAHELREESKKAKLRTTSRTNHEEGELRTRIRRLLTLMESTPFEEAVLESVQGAVAVLKMTARDFQRGRNPYPMRIFKQLQQGIDKARDSQKKFQSWPGEKFADWLEHGEVLAVAPPGHVWSRLLHEAHDSYGSSGPPPMVGQLVPLLALWHRAVIARPRKEDAEKRIDTLFALNLIKLKRFVAPARMPIRKNAAVPKAPVANSPTPAPAQPMLSAKI